MKIENQAMMFAFLCKYTVLAKGEEGREVIQEGMKRYGRERGARMAMRAERRGDPVCLWTNQAYGEWKPDFAGQMEFGTEQTEPTLVTYISKCAWCEAWKKYDILEYGREYCVNVDAAVYEGFGHGFGCGAVCTPVSKAMSWGGDICRFDWGLPLSSGDQEKISERKAELGTSAMKDFAYHTAHIYCSVADEICKAFPDDSHEILKKAVNDYIGLFGQEDYDALLEYSTADFHTI
ncbi:MAG: L-2-amino-thiazoline-4-carboxylic acid hydrolase [Mogibacterium sp.]|nr:L-2-amino-thiazoline-4-carboxylic acid hydrolase [Mogibacterium sp.]